MFDETEAKHSALGNIRQMLKDGRAKRLGGLGAKPEAPPAALGKPALEIHIHGAAPVEGSPAEEAAEPTAEAAAEGDLPKAEPHPLVALAMKKLDQIHRPKKG